MGFIGRLRVSQRATDDGGPPPIDRRWEDVNPWEHEDARLSPRRLLELLRASLRLVWRASPSETINLLVLQTLSGLALPAQVLAAQWALARIVSSTVAVVGLAALLFTVYPLLVAGLLVAMVPLSWASVAGGRAYYRYASRRTPKRRLIAYLQGLLSQLDSGKEIRAFALGPYLLKHRRRLFDEEMADLRKLIRERLRGELLATLASSAVIAGGVVFILWLHFSQRISLAETVAAAGALLLMPPRMNALTGGVGQLHENALFVEDLWSFVAVESRQITPDSPAAMPATLEALRVDDVTFRYRDGAAPVLHGVSMEIRIGETVAVVGENGEAGLAAGSSTATSCRSGNGRRSPSPARSSATRRS